MGANVVIVSVLLGRAGWLDRKQGQAVGRGGREAGPGTLKKQQQGGGCSAAGALTPTLC